MELLDDYRDTQDFDVIRELVRVDCDCKRVWRLMLNAQEPLPLKERVAKSYEVIGRGVLGAKWWTEHGERVFKDVLHSRIPGGNKSQLE